jgi:Skp family chaperone for outer membrane proteins
MKTSFEKFMASSAVQSVELGVVDFDKYITDVKSKQQEVDNAIKKFETISAEIQKFKSEFFRHVVDLQNIKELAQKQLSKDVKAAQDLGLDDSAFKKKYFEITKAVDDTIKKIDNNTRNIK